MVRKLIGLRSERRMSDRARRGMTDPQVLRSQSAAGAYLSADPYVSTHADTGNEAHRLVEGGHQLAGK